MRWLRLSLKVGLPLLVLGVGFFGARTILQNKAEPNRRPQAPASRLTVEATALKPQDYQINVNTYGTIQAQTESALVSQVAGNIVEVSPNFREGGFFRKGETLVRIDPTDYRSEVQIAETTLVQSYLTLKEEEARAEQALRNWARLGQAGTPSDLVLRKPQMDAARAAIDANRIRLERAKRNLERTKIVAPYAGRVLRKNVDVGQFVGTGAQLAQLYAVDYVEVRLPLHSQQLQYVALPEEYRGTSNNQGPKVQFVARTGQQSHLWEGRITRTEGIFDEQSRQLFVVAQIPNPYRNANDGKPSLKLGQFVEAEIEGQSLKEAIVIPRAAIYQGNEVVLIKDGKLQRKAITVLWSNADEAVVSAGLQAGDLLALTPVGSLPSGTEVNAIVDGKPSREEVSDGERRTGRGQQGDGSAQNEKPAAPATNNQPPTSEASAPEKVAATR
jgi:RND family efflux transporter MFP subunit